jgi:F0F1-type ATP synthase assembly protein I
LLGAFSGTLIGLLASIAIAEKITFTTPLIIVFVLLALFIGLLSIHVYKIERRKGNLWKNITQGDSDAPKQLDS